MNINKKIGTLIRQIRKKHNISMMELAEALKTTQPRLSRIESGEQDIQVSFIESFCSHFQIPINEFFQQLDDAANERELIDKQLQQALLGLGQKQKETLFNFLQSLRDE